VWLLELEMLLQAYNQNNKYVLIHGFKVTKKMNTRLEQVDHVNINNLTSKYNLIYFV